MAAENLTIAQLFFVHIRAVCMYVKVKYPALTILMWDDMLRFLELPVLVGKCPLACKFFIYSDNELFCSIDPLSHRDAF